jgi:hypothetical protein
MLTFKIWQRRKQTCEPFFSLAIGGYQSPSLVTNVCDAAGANCTNQNVPKLMNDYIRMTHTTTDINLNTVYVISDPVFPHYLMERRYTQEQLDEEIASSNDQVMLTTSTPTSGADDDASYTLGFIPNFSRAIVKFYDKTFENTMMYGVGVKIKPYIKNDKNFEFILETPKLQDMEKKVLCINEYSEYVFSSTTTENYIPIVFIIYKHPTISNNFVFVCPLLNNDKYLNLSQHTSTSILSHRVSHVSLYSKQSLGIRDNVRAECYKKKPGEFEYFEYINGSESSCVRQDVCGAFAKSKNKSLYMMKKKICPDEKGICYLSYGDKLDEYNITHEKQPIKKSCKPEDEQLYYNYDQEEPNTGLLNDVNLIDESSRCTFTPPIQPPAQCPDSMKQCNRIEKRTASISATGAKVKGNITCGPPVTSQFTCEIDCTFQDIINKGNVYVCKNENGTNCLTHVVITTVIPSPGPRTPARTVTEEKYAWRDKSQYNWYALHKTEDNYVKFAHYGSAAMIDNDHSRGETILKFTNGTPDNTMFKIENDNTIRPKLQPHLCLNNGNPTNFSNGSCAQFYFIR